VILLDLSLPDSQGLDTFASMKAHAPGTPIVLLTGNDDDAMALRAVEAGAQDYLVKDRLEGPALVRALRYAVVRQQNAPGGELSGNGPGIGRLIGVMGCKGGVGTTTFACHLAHHLAGLSRGRVLLADLDLGGGSAGFLMQADSPYTILDAAENVHRLDAGFWQSIVSRARSGVDVIASPALLGQVDEPAPARFRHVLRSARKHYDFVVADLGRLNGLSRLLAPELDRLYLAATSSLVAVHDAGRVLESLSNAGVSPEAVLLIHNQATRWSSGASVLKAVVDLKIHAALPSCDAELAAALAKGEFLDHSTGYGGVAASLAAAEAGTDGGPAAATGFSLKRLNPFGGRESQPAVQG